MNPHRHAVVVLVQGPGGVAQAQVHASQQADVIAQDLLDDGLRYLLAGLGEVLIADRRQAEGIVEVGDPAPGQGLAEGDPLRPGDR